VSSLHWNVTPAWVSVNVNVADADATVPVGPLVIVGAGGVVLIVHVRVAAVPSGLPVAFAATWNVCDPSNKPA